MTEKIKFTSKRFYKWRFHNAINLSCHLVYSSCRLVACGVVLSTCHVMFQAYPIKKSWTGLWTLEPVLRTSPPNKKM